MKSDSFLTKAKNVIFNKSCLICFVLINVSCLAIFYTKIVSEDIFMSYDFKKSNSDPRHFLKNLDVLNFNKFGSNRSACNHTFEHGKSNFKWEFFLIFVSYKMTFEPKTISLNFFDQFDSILVKINIWLLILGLIRGKIGFEVICAILRQKIDPIRIKTSSNLKTYPE